MLDEAIFTYPAHPNWGGTALISAAGKLIGIGSLQLERAREGKNEHLNMVVPIDLLKPVLDDLRKFGRVNRPVRPWLGLYSTEIEDKIVVVGIAPKGPAARAEIKTGDVVVAVKGESVSTLAGFYRKVWALGQAGVEVPLTLYREGVTFDVRVNSSDRAKFLKGPRLALTRRSAFLDLVHAVRIEGEMVFDLCHRRERLLVTPHRILGAATIDHDAEVAGIAFVRAMRVMIGALEQTHVGVGARNIEAPACSSPPSTSALAWYRRSRGLQK